MYQPELYSVALALMIVSMCCWGSWANTMKLTGSWPFQAFYWDYVIGLGTATVVLGTLFGGGDFFRRLAHADGRHVLLAVAAGAVFNVANLLLVAAIDLAGMAVAFPVGIGLALVVGVLLNFLLAPVGNARLIGLGVMLVLGAILLDALAYKRRDSSPQSRSTRGLVISVIAGILMGLFYPLVVKSLSGPARLDAYTVACFFAVGVAGCALPLNLLFMRKPINGSEPVSWRAYSTGRAKWHGAAILGGMIWSLGTEANFVASQAHIVGPATSYALGQGATMISAFWGVFVWKEFQNAPPLSRRLLPFMFVLFILGLGCIALAPIVSGRVNP